MHPLFRVAALGATVGRSMALMIDKTYPGTAVERLNAVHGRVATLTREQLDAKWPDVRRALLWAGGLKDLTDVAPGRGNTGHASLCGVAERSRARARDGADAGTVLPPQVQRLQPLRSLLHARRRAE